MTSASRRTVLTGIGVLSPIGSDPATYWQSLLDRKSGVRPIRRIDASDMPSRIAADVPDFDPKKLLEKDQRKAIRVMARTVQLGVCVANITLKDASLLKGSIDPKRIGIDFGSAMVHSELDDIGRASKLSTNGEPDSVSLKTWGEIGIKEIQPTWMLKYLPNMPACHITVNNDMQGPSNTITSGEVSSLLAMAEGWRIIERNLVDVMMVGGCDSKLNPLNFLRQSLFQSLTRRNDEPAKALRPFDKNRDGTVLSEGAIAITIEELEHAQKRGAKIYAELVGFAAGFDREKQGVVLARVIQRALRNAGITPEEIDHVNAHGLGSQDADLWEAKGISQVFGNRTPVLALKGYLGAGGPAGSLVEMLASILAFQHGQLPSTLNCEDPDPRCAIWVHNEGLRPVTKPYALKISMTELGHVAVAIIKRWEQ